MLNRVLKTPLFLYAVQTYGIHCNNHCHSTIVPCFKYQLSLAEECLHSKVGSTLLHAYRYESMRVSTSPTRISKIPTRISKSQLNQEIIIIQLVKYNNSLIGLNITFSYQLELESKTNPKQIGEISTRKRSLPK